VKVNNKDEVPLPGRYQLPPSRLRPKTRWILWFCYLGNYARFLYLSSPLFARGAIEHLIAQPPYHHLPGLYLGHFWSLCVEEQFYLLWPLVTLGCLRLARGRLRLLATVALIAALGGGWQIRPTGRDPSGLALPTLAGRDAQPSRPALAPAVQASPPVITPRAVLLAPTAE